MSPHSVALTICQNSNPSLAHANGWYLYATWTLPTQLSHFHHCPCVGHIDPLKHVCGYGQKFLHGALWFHNGIPDHESRFGDKPGKYDWMVSMYGSPREEIPDDAPTPKGCIVWSLISCKIW